MFEQPGSLYGGKADDVQEKRRRIRCVLHDDADVSFFEHNGEELDVLQVLHFMKDTLLRERVPERSETRENFSVEVIESEDGAATVLLRRDDGAVCDVGAEFLAQGYAIVFHDDLAERYPAFVAWDTRTVNIARGAERLAPFLFLLLHECGHTHQKGREFFVSEHKREQLRRDVAARIHRDFSRKGLWHRAQLLDFVEDNIPLWFREEEAAKAVRQERNANAFALRALRALEEEGYNVFADFSREDVRNAMNFALLTHQMEWLQFFEHIASVRNHSPQRDALKFLHRRKQITFSLDDADVLDDLS